MAAAADVVVSGDVVVVVDVASDGERDSVVVVDVAAVALDGERDAVVVVDVASDGERDAAIGR